MAHHVTDERPTHHMSICAATREITDQPRWFHMCGLSSDHSTVHHCGEPDCDAAWSDI